MNGLQMELDARMVVSEEMNKNSRGYGSAYISAGPQGYSGASGYSGLAQGSFANYINSKSETLGNKTAGTPRSASYNAVGAKNSY